MASRICTHRFERVPSVIPARLPAWLRSWHGEPPVMMSTGSTCDQSTAVMSPRFGTDGQCAARTFDGAASFSQNHATVPPNTYMAATSSPPFNSLRTGFQSGASQTYGTTSCRSYRLWHGRQRGS